MLRNLPWVDDWLLGYNAHIVDDEPQDLAAVCTNFRPSVTRGAQSQGAGRPGWMASWGSQRKADQHIVCGPVTHRATPAWAE